MNKFIINLQLFADGAGETGSDAAVQTEGVKDSAAEVKYGIQKSEEASVAEVQAQPQEIDRDAEFEKLIKGDYKEQYDARMQKTIQSRLKSSKETVDKYNSLTPTLELLAKKYGVADATDIDALNKAIQADDTLFEDEAMKNDMTVEQYKQFRDMRLENEQLKQRMQEQERQEKGRQLYQTWMQQAEQVKQIYPSFDLQTEMKNPTFMDLLGSHIDVKTAYEVLHNDEIISGAMKYTADKVRGDMARSLAANSALPKENGTGSRSAAVVKNDVTKLTDKDIDEVMRRVARGEYITFG